MEMSNTSIIMMKDNKGIVGNHGESVDGVDGVDGGTVKPGFEFQIIDKPEIGFFDSDKMLELEAIDKTKHSSRPVYLNIFQW